MSLIAIKEEKVSNLLKIYNNTLFQPADLKDIKQFDILV